MSEVVRAWWMLSPNFGDALAPWMLHAISGQTVVYVNKRAPVRKYITLGSVLNHADENSVVWGAGLAHLEHQVSPSTHIYAVRGPLSRMRALACGTPCPEVYGDPALLLPRLLKRSPDPKYAVGVIPHFEQRYALPEPGDDVCVIDVLDGVENVVEKILQCERVVCSALHPIIVAHAYGIPASWVDFGPPIGGDGSKFVDYALSLDIFDQLKLARLDPRVVRDATLLRAQQYALPSPEKLTAVADKLLSECPVPRKYL